FGVLPALWTQMRRAASPRSEAAPDDPPVLLFHGTDDTTVAPAQSERLFTNLRAAGATATLVDVQNTDHLFTSTGDPLTPSLEQIVTQTADWFDRYVSLRPPVDQPPVAALRGACPALTCTPDASASPVDRGITSYSWDGGAFPNCDETSAVISFTYPHAGRGQPASR